MSSKAEKRTKVESPKVVRPVAAVPRATVEARHGGETMTRSAKGFSRGEVSEAGLPGYLAARWNVPRDIRRRSVLAPNVEALRGWFAGAKKTPPKPEPKAAEEKKRPKKRATRKKAAK